MTETVGRLAALLATVAITVAGYAQSTHVAEPLPGISTSGQPDEAALAELADEGFVAVIDLRGPAEDRGLNEQDAVETLGMTYVSLPISGPEAVNYANASVLDEILRGLDRPVLIHCATGNRAGALLALRERLIGSSTTEALQTGIEAGMTSPSLRSTVEAQLRAHP